MVSGTLGRHLVSLLWASLGPVMAPTRTRGPATSRTLILHHAGGASSVSPPLRRRRGADGSDVWLWGEACGDARAPRETDPPVGSLRLPLAELAANARSGQPRHDCDVLFGPRSRPHPRGRAAPARTLEPAQPVSINGRAPAVLVGRAGPRCKPSTYSCGTKTAIATPMAAAEAISTAPAAPSLGTLASGWRCGDLGDRSLPRSRVLNISATRTHADGACR